MINQKKNWKTTLQAYLYLLPMLLVLLVFCIYPIVQSFLMSIYTKYDFFTNKVGAIGWDNFRYLFADPDFYIALKNTLIFVFGVVPLTIVLSLIIALMLNKLRWFSSLFRTIYFLPFVTSTVAIAMVWNWIYHSNYGFLNYLLGLVGIQPINWLNDPHYAMWALIIMSVWKGLGFNIILFLVGLNNIDNRYYQAAAIDGANSW
ncbi:sugar ABC transporter permease, partial [Lactobacillus sp. XV13L]|nr:sugar ABC transporter permease [Lactobacillus sp. XV13L]